MMTLNAQAFEKLLLPGSRSRIDLARRDTAFEVCERYRARLDRGAELSRPTRVALLARRRERALLDHVRTDVAKQSNNSCNQGKKEPRDQDGKNCSCLASHDYGPKGVGLRFCIAMRLITVVVVKSNNLFLIVFTLMVTAGYRLPAQLRFALIR